MSVRRNVIANYLGQSWIALMGVVFLPLYINYLGIEAYGLVGLFVTVQALFLLLDFGMTPTLSREMSRYGATGSADTIRSVLRTMEYVSIVTTVVCAAVIWCLSGWVAESWIHVEKLPLDQASDAIAVMGAVAGLRLTEGLYRGAMIGLQRQVALNAFSAILATIRWAGGVGVMAWWSPTIVAFFRWQAAVSLLTVIVLAHVVYRGLPITSSATRFSIHLLSDKITFSSGMMANAALALLLTQLDKVLLSRILSLEAFGYYTMAATVASLVLQLVTPISQAYYPQLARQLASNDIAGLKSSYRLSYQLVCSAVFPLGMLLAFYGDSILLLWTGSEVMAGTVFPLLMLLAIANMLHGTMFMPNMLRLAYGWSWYAVKLNSVAVLVLVPAILWATPRFGAVGAAWVWLVLNFGYIMLGIPYMHRKVLPGEMGKWFREGLFIPLLAVVAVMSFGNLVRPDSDQRILTFVFLAVAWMTSVTAVISFSSSLRSIIRDSMK